MAQEKPKLLDQLREAIRVRHYSIRTEEAYVQWVKRYIYFQGKRHPGDLSENRVNQFLSHLDGAHRLMYGGGLRLMEIVRLRIKDVDYGYNRIVVGDGKGGKDRVTMLPQSVKPRLEEHMAEIQSLFRADRQERIEGVYLPAALASKYPRAGVS